MGSPVPYSLALVGLILIASLSMLGLADKASDQENCLLQLSCRECLGTKLANKTEGNNGTTCLWEYVASGPRCVAREEISEGVLEVIYNAGRCRDTPTTVAPNTTTSSTTTETPATNGTTTIPTTPSTTSPPTNGTTTPTPTTNGTTTTPPTTTAPTNGTTTPATPTTSAPPTTPTTAPPKPTPTPSKGGFSWASFIGGIVFAAALSSLAYLIWRFYKVRLDRNYHTLSTNLI